MYEQHIDDDCEIVAYFILLNIDVDICDMVYWV